MKKLLYLITITTALQANAQVAIGKSAVTNSSVSLEFYDGGNNVQGMVLPWVNGTGSVVSPENGTLVYDYNTRKVWVKYNTGWKDLSIDATGMADTSLQDALSDLSNAKVSIGKPSAKKGILVLEDNNKAMILPKVAYPHLNIINPAPGMMAYDTKTNQLAVFNGTVWSFWKP